MQMVRHIEEEEDADRGDLIEMGVFKLTSGNATKRLRMRQETRGTTRAAKTAEAALKQIASQEFQAKKGKMQVWKQMIMKEVALELQTVKELAEAQRVEMELLRKQVQEMEVKSEILERELRVLRAKEQNSGQHSGKQAPATKNPGQPTTQRESPESLAEAGWEEMRPIATSGSEDTTPAPHFSSAKNAKKRNYASVAASKPAQAPEHPWTQVVYKSQKQPATKPNVKVEDQGRRILFPRVLSQQKSEADLMLASNKALQKAGEGLDTRFIRVKDAPSGAILALLTEQANARLLIPWLSNLLIRTVKTVDPAIVEVEILENWQRLKVHEMPLESYLGEGKMELLKREVKSSTGVQLKTVPRWLINEDRLREAQTTGNKYNKHIYCKGKRVRVRVCGHRIFQVLGDKW